MATAGDYQAYAVNAANNAGFPPDVFLAQINQESGWNPDAVSPAGAVGIAQFMPATAAGMGIDPHDPWQSLDAAARLDAGNLSAFGSVELALAAYNAGGGAVQRYGGIPPYDETQRYVANILAAAGGSDQAQMAAPGGDGVQPSVQAADVGGIPRPVLIGGAVLLALWAIGEL